MTVLYVTHPASLLHDPQVLSPDHPDHPDRLAAIEAALADARLDGLERLSAPAASEAELALVHHEAHIAFIRDLCAAGGGEIDADTYVGEASYQAALHAAGGACALVRALSSGEVTTGFCALRPAGHHAERDRAMGFCLFNNVSIAAELAIRTFGVRKVMIIDWDVHHGNGTAEVFRHRRDVLVANIHQSGLFPGTGAMADIGSGDGQPRTPWVKAWWRRSPRSAAPARRSRPHRTPSSPPEQRHISVTAGHSDCPTAAARHRYRRAARRRVPAPLRNSTSATSVIVARIGSVSVSCSDRTATTTRS